MLRDAEVDNSREEELPSVVTTCSGRVSRLPNGYRIFFGGKINKPTSDEQTKNNGEGSPLVTSPVVRESTAPLDQDKLSLLLTALGGAKQRQIHSFVSTPVTEVLQQI